MTEQHVNRGGNLFALFLFVVLLAAALPTRERDLYPFAPGETGLLGSNILQAEDEFPDGPALQMTRAVAAARSAVAALDRRGAPPAGFAGASPQDSAQLAAADPQAGPAASTERGLSPALAAPLVVGVGPPAANPAPGVFPADLSVPGTGGLPGAAGSPSETGTSSSGGDGPPTSSSGGTTTTSGRPPGGNDPIAAVPEPSAWVLLIAGFMLVGAALRRRVRTQRLLASR